MNLFDLEEKKVKTVRVLWYPNCTFMKNLEQDSFVQVAKNQIKLLNQIRNDLWHYMILPCPVESLQFENVTQLYTEFETYPPTMRSNFRVDVIRKMLHSSLDFDLVMSHLPEHTHQLVNTLYNVTHHIPPVFGYAHWFDLKSAVAWPKDSFLQNITGLLEYDRCYINTNYQKKLVITQAKETFNDATIERLDSILTVQHLGVNREDIVPEINETPEKVIVFNHRPDTYKNYNGFLKVCDELWRQRQDFKVWVPLLNGKPNRPYLTNESGDKKFYYKRLKTCYVGFSPKQAYGGWSVATTDGMMNGVPYIMYNDTYYKELHPQGDFFDNDRDALMLLNTYLDDPRYRNEEAEKALDCIQTSLIYKDKIIEMNNYMNDLLSRQKVMGDSEKLKEIIEFIKKSKSVSKYEMTKFVGWGRGIKWTPYRRALMNHPNIFDRMDEHPTYCWKEKNEDCITL